MVVRLSRRTGDEEEGRTLVRGSQSKHGYGKYPGPPNSGSSSNATVWKTTTFLLFILLALIVSETIEVKRPSNGDREVSLGGVVEMKTSISSLSTQPFPDASQNDGDRSGPNNTSPPTESPEPDPTESPTTTPQISAIGVPMTAKTENPTAPPTDAPKGAEPNDLPTPLPGEEIPHQFEPEKAEINQPTATTAVLASARTTERHTYQRRGQPMSDEDRKAMTDRWGQWTLVDNKERPSTDYYAAYPNRDIPRSAFPPNAWQLDTEYLSKFLPEAIQLVERTQEAILVEYGKTEGSFKERAEMFELEVFETLEGRSNYVITKPEWRKDETGERGGWSTVKSLEGLKRRLLHAVMTEDTFVFALGGHSAAAGHGNLFVQSYSIQVQWILEAVFARLGVRHQSKNFANGGLGTIQHGIAASSIYGPSIDMLMWDSAMTEKESSALEVFARQAIIGGNKVPVLWGLLGGVAKELSLNFDADVGTAGRGTFGVGTAESLEEVNAMPWAVRYLKCGSDINQICKDNKYIGHCWDSESHPDIEPPTKQESVPSGRAGWHPGNRSHQLIGRVLTFTILQSLKECLNEWNETDGYAISDDTWHITPWYENIRSKMEDKGPEFGNCKDLVEHDLEWTCKYPVKARTEFTPRAYPAISSIRTLMPPEMVNLIPEPDRPIYEPPEAFNKDLHPPSGSLDLLNIVEAGVDFKSTMNPDYATEYYRKPMFPDPPKVTLGNGVGLISKAGDEFCDGSADSFCGKGPDEKCLLAGTNDARNGLIIDGFSGWTVMNIPDLKFGYVALKFETWHKSGDNPQTHGWNSAEGENHKRRVLKGDDAPEYCDGFQFEYAIDGKVSILSKDEFLKRVHLVQRVVEIISILKDPAYTGGEEKEVEVAFRITGCERVKTFVLSHVYWA